MKIEPVASAVLAGAALLATAVPASAEERPRSDLSNSGILQAVQGLTDTDDASFFSTFGRNPGVVGTVPKSAAQRFVDNVTAPGPES
ncbi:hypothetical protein AB0K09_07895 [Streptomyces sp. NPDC049577]|uniref:hypothetical protein n=1 Tax=Streptomyces sp. NPDC049577 TaxID=3155153 RepID=UPI0034180B6A